MPADINWVRTKYNQFSKEFFGDNLPDVQFVINNRLHEFGMAKCDTFISPDGKPVMGNFKLCISNAYERDEKSMENTLLHEMIHLFDYYTHPEHFVVMKNGEYVTNRKYDAHGSDLFLPMASRINQFGYNVQQYVNSYEYELSDKMKNKLEKPLNLCYAEYMSMNQKDRMFICSDITLENIIQRYSSPEYNRFAPATIYVYQVSSPELRTEYAMTKGNMIRGYAFTMNEWFALLEHLHIDDKAPDRTITLKNIDMYENKRVKEPIRITENDLKEIIRETLSELANNSDTNPVDGGNAVMKQVSPTRFEISVV